MHVAICDDDIAHRKHFERLMNRESDARMVVDSPLYIDSFGNEEQIMHNPMQYDVFFLSLKKPAEYILEIISRLREKNVVVPIVIVRLNGTGYPCEGEIANVLYIDDPLKQSELRNGLTAALEFSNHNRYLYEIRTIHNTYYFQEKEILYACGDSIKYHLTLKDGREIMIEHGLEEFYQTTFDDLAFIFSGLDTIINIRYVVKIHLFHITMCNGKRIPIHIRERSKIKKLHRQFQRD